MSNRQSQLEAARKYSLFSPKSDLVIDDEDGREFFRFVHGRLEEYELTRYSVIDPTKGRIQKIVRLLPEEIEAANEFSCEMLTS